MKAKEMSKKELAKYIDYSVLKPEFSEQEIREQVQLSVDFQCKTVCINPWSINIAKEIVKGSETLLCVVCDFPFGASSSKSRLEQARLILEEQDIAELDLVINYGVVRSGKKDKIVSDLKPIVQLCHEKNCKIKVIFESDALSYDEIDLAIEACIEAGADFIKTSTGFYTGSKMHGDKSGGFREMIDHMIKKADGKCMVKASGAIRDRQHFLDLIDMGVDRMGVGYKSVPVVLDDSRDGVSDAEY